MDDIGSTDDTALLCHTNEPSRRDSEGDWFAPNGTKVGNYTDSMPRDVPGFGRTRSPHVVRLKWYSTRRDVQVCCERYNKHQSSSLCGHLFSKRYVTQC